MNNKTESWSHYCHEQHQEFYLTLAKKYLAYLGNKTPSINQLLEMQWLLSQTFVQRLMSFDSRLTQDEAMTLYLSARGKTIKQIARFCDLSTRQVERYRRSIFVKLGCKNMTEAVIKGIRFLELSPSLLFSI